MDNNWLSKAKLRCLQMRKPTPNHPGLPLLLTSSPFWTAWVWLTSKYLPNPAFPLVLLTAGCAPYLVSLTLTGIWPETYRNTIVASASALFWHFHFWYMILIILLKSNWIKPNAMGVHSDKFSSSPSSRLCFIQVTAPSSQETSGAHVFLLLQLQDCRVDTPAGSPQLQSQVVNSNAEFDWWYTAFSWLCCACRGGAIQDEPYHDDRWRTGCRVWKLGGEDIG